MAKVFTTLSLLCALPTVRSVFVLDVGAPRSGVQSMFEALKKLGLNSLWSGYYTGMRWPWCDYLFGNVTTPPLEALRGWEAAMDEPFHLIYEEVLQAIPDSKFVYTVADADTWYESYLEYFRRQPETESYHIFERNAWPLITEPVNRMGSLRGHRTALKQNSFPVLPGPPANIDDSALAWDADLASWSCQSVHFWGCRFEDNELRNDPSVRQRCLSGFRQHREKVLRTIPKDRLLIFNLSDGWGPLCEFLGKPVPSEPFPHVDRFYVLDDDQSSASTGVALMQHAAQRLPRKEL